MKRPILPPTYLLVAMLLIVLLHLFAPLEPIFSMPWNLFGLLPLGFGLVVTLSADRAFQRVGTTVHPYKEPSQLIAHGAFRYSRNPMYLGFVLILLGMAVLLSSLSPFAVVLGFALAMDIVFIRVEERILAAMFGEDWARYQRRVRK